MDEQDDHHDYPYRIRARHGDVHLLWTPGHGDAPDLLATEAASGRLLIFDELEGLADHCDRHGLSLCLDGAGSLDLTEVHAWVHAGSASAGPDTAARLLEGWNFFEDLARSVLPGLGAQLLHSQGPLHDSAYEKLFGGEALAATPSPGAWTEAETRAVRELLSAGLQLWASAAADAALVQSADRR